MASSSSRADAAPVSIVGAGIAGTWAALLFAKEGYRVALYDQSEPPFTGGTSHWAGGMLAPDCEAEGSEPMIVRLGHRAVDLWRAHCPEVSLEGSLVVSHPRDRSDFERFARQTSGYERIGPERIAELEPALEGRFREALFFPAEGHVEPRRVLPALHDALRSLGVAIHFGEAVEPGSLPGTVIDCRGLGARKNLPDLRGVKGETAVIETAEISFRRPIRLMHPRWPLYIVPRPGNRFLIGATTIESEDTSGVAVRSALELLSAAYALHPAFGEARIVEIGTGLRPSFPDNNPRIQGLGRTASGGEMFAINGLYRHGILLAPAMAELALRYVRDGARDNEVMR